MKHIKQLFIMGGSVAGIGNVSPNVEFNFAGDPEAAFITLSASLKRKAVLLPWETVLNSDATKI